MEIISVPLSDQQRERYNQLLEKLGQLYVKNYELLEKRLPSLIRLILECCNFSSLVEKSINQQRTLIGYNYKDSLKFLELKKILQKYKKFNIIVFVSSPEIKNKLESFLKSKTNGYNENLSTNSCIRYKKNSYIQIIEDDKIEKQKDQIASKDLFIHFNLPYRFESFYNRIIISMQKRNYIFITEDTLEEKIWYDFEEITKNLLGNELTDKSKLMKEIFQYNVSHLKIEEISKHLNGYNKGFPLLGIVDSGKISKAEKILIQRPFGEHNSSQEIDLVQIKRPEIQSQQFILDLSSLFPYGIPIFELYSILNLYDYKNKYGWNIDQDDIRYLLERVIDSIARDENLTDVQISNRADMVEENLIKKGFIKYISSLGKYKIKDKCFQLGKIFIEHFYESYSEFNSNYFKSIIINISSILLKWVKKLPEEGNLSGISQYVRETFKELNVLDHSKIIESLINLEENMDKLILDLIEDISRFQADLIKSRHKGENQETLILKIKQTVKKYESIFSIYSDNIDDIDNFYLNLDSYFKSIEELSEQLSDKITWFMEEKIKNLNRDYDEKINLHFEEIIRHLLEVKDFSFNFKKIINSIILNQKKYIDWLLSDLEALQKTKSINKEIYALWNHIIYSALEEPNNFKTICPILITYKQNIRLNSDHVDETPFSEYIFEFETKEKEIEREKSKKRQINNYKERKKDARDAFQEFVKRKRLSNQIIDDSIKMVSEITEPAYIVQTLYDFLKNHKNLNKISDFFKSGFFVRLYWFVFSSLEGIRFFIPGDKRIGPKITLKFNDGELVMNELKYIPIKKENVG